MRFGFLVGSLILVLVGGLFESSWTMALGGVGVLSCLAIWGSAPRRLVVVFGIWTAGILAYLLWSGDSAPDTTMKLLGLPAPAFWMLLGIWVVPLLIWPLSFIRDFDRWKRQ
ncbi:MAG: hypothetical protein P8020_05070 [Acidobacteriota bacterium]|jgi:hypothetical protein